MAWPGLIPDLGEYLISVYWNECMHAWMKEQMSKWICKALIWKKGQTYSRSFQGECNTQVVDGNSSADLGFTLRKNFWKLKMWENGLSFSGRRSQIPWHQNYSNNIMNHLMYKLYKQACVKMKKLK